MTTCPSCAPAPPRVGTPEPRTWASCSPRPVLPSSLGEGKLRPGRERTGCIPLGVKQTWLTPRPPHIPSCFPCTRGSGQSRGRVLGWGAAGRDNLPTRGLCSAQEQGPRPQDPCSLLRGRRCGLTSPREKEAAAIVHSVPEKGAPRGGGESSREVAVCGAGTGKVVAEHLAGGGERAACLQRSWRCRRTLQPEGGPLAGAAPPRSSRAPGAGAVTPLRGAPVAGGGQPGAHRPGGPHAGPRRPHPGNPAACSPAGRPGHRRELPPGPEMSAGPVRVSHTHPQGEIPLPSEEGGPPDSAPRPAPRPRASVPLSIDKGRFPVCCVCVWGEGLVPLPWRQAGWGGGRGGSGQGLAPPHIAPV